MIRPALLSAIVLLAGCARSEEARYAPVDNTQLPADNIALGDENGLTVGTWQTGLQQDRLVLEFGPAGAAALFTLGCDDRRNLQLQWPAAAPGGELPVVFMQTGSETRRLSVVSVDGATPTLRGALATNDPFVRILTGTRSPIMVRIGEAPALVMPPSPTITTYVQQCAAGEVRGTPPVAVGNTVEPSGAVNVVAGNAATTANAQ